MPRQTACPVCGNAIDPRVVRGASFRCPHCQERLRPVLYGTGPGRWLIILFIVVIFLEGGFEVFGRFGYVVALVLAGVFISLLNQVVAVLFGSTLEPAGRVGLGDSEE